MTKLVEKMMKKRVLLKFTDLKKIQETIKNVPAAAPEEREFTVQEAVSFLAQEIKSLREKGYSFESISKILANNGLKTSPLTLRKYISNSNKKNIAKKKPSSQTDDGSHSVVSNKDKIKSSTPLEPGTKPGRFIIKDDSAEI